MRRPRDSGASFEETYPRYPFAALVRAAIAAGHWIGRASARRRRRRARQAFQVPLYRAAVPGQRRKETVPPPMGRILY